MVRATRHAISSASASNAKVLSRIRTIFSKDRKIHMLFLLSRILRTLTIFLVASRMQAFHLCMVRSINCDFDKRPV